MPLPFLFHVVEHGPPEFVVTHWRPILKTVLTVAVLVLVKLYVAGATQPYSPEERPLHGKVILLTGGTSGVGAAVALELASRGAQLVLLTRAPPGDPFVADYVADLRARSGNALVYAEHVDLTDLHAVRVFATRWIDNTPPRRLDMVVLCAATLCPPGTRQRSETAEGVDETWTVNFLANFHLLAILSPALRAQPFDRDVRIVVVTCSGAYISSPSLRDGGSPLREDDWTPARAYARSKLALMVFGRAFQKHLDAFKRPDGMPMTARVVFADPGLSRTPGTRRWLTRGSLWGLALYLLAYFVPWLLLKSPGRGAQSILYAVLEPDLRRIPGGQLIKECRVVDVARAEIDDDEVAKKLWEGSDKLIEAVEKAQALERARAKKKEQEEKRAQEEREKVEEIKELVEAIKKGKAAQGKNPSKGT